MNRFAGRIAVVTGASRGLGREISRTFAAHGAHVAVVARTLSVTEGRSGSLAETVAEITSAGGRATPFVADLSDPSNCVRLAEQIRTELGVPTVLVNNAAVTFLRPLLDFPLRRVQVMLNLHLLSPLQLTQALAPGMADAGGGWVLNLTSLAAVAPQGPPYDEFATNQGFGIYGTVKAALDRLTPALAAELHGSGIAVNAAAPYLPVATPGAAALHLAQDETENVSLICRTALELCSGDRALLTGRIAYTQPFLEALDSGEIPGAYPEAAATGQ